MGAAISATQMGGRQRARRWSRFQQLDRRAYGLLDAGEATVRQHEQHRCANGTRLELGGERGEIALGQRLDVGVDHRRRRALVFTNLGGHLDRGRQRQSRVVLGKEVDGLPLVARVGAGMQEHDRKRSDAVGLQPCCALEQRALVKGRVHLALDGHAFRDLQPPAARDQRGWLQDLDVVELVFALAPDLERVAEALGRNEPGRRPLALDHGVAEQRGGMRLK